MPHTRGTQTATRGRAGGGFTDPDAFSQFQTSARPGELSRVGGAEFFAPGGFGGGTQDALQMILDALAQAGVDVGGQPTEDPQQAARQQEALRLAPQPRPAEEGTGTIFTQGGVTQRLRPGPGIQGSDILSVTGGFAPGSFGDRVQQMILQALQGAGGGGGDFDLGLPTREELLGPRTADINDIIDAARQRTLNQFGALGRDVSGTVPSNILGEFEERRGREVSRAGGEIDTLLAQLGLQGRQFEQSRRQNELTQLINLLNSL